MRLPKKLAATVSAGLLAVTLTACGATADAEDATTRSGADGGATGRVVTTAAEVLADDAEVHADADDGDYDGSSATRIRLADGASTVTGDGASVSGDVVTISQPGTYLVSGTLTDGQVVVDSAADGKVVVVLDGADITSTSSSPLVVAAADEAVVVLADGTRNHLTDGAGSTADDEEEDAPTATLFSMADLTIAGDGSLSVTSHADGITSKDGLVLLSGHVRVRAADDGVRGKDYLVVEGGTLRVDAADDGLKADNEDDPTKGYIALSGGTVDVRAGDDGVKAVTDVIVSGGTLSVARSNEAVEAQLVVIDDGTLDLAASDDGINGSSDAGGNALVVNGGRTTVTAGGDGLDVNGGPVTITGGTVVVNGPTAAGNGSLDADGGVYVDGGSLSAVGSADMLVSPSSDSEQAWVVVTFDTVSAGSTLTLVAENGDVVATQSLAEDVASWIVSEQELADGASYTVEADGEQVATATAGEAATGGGMGGDPGGQPPGDGAPAAPQDGDG